MCDLSILSLLFSASEGNNSTSFSEELTESNGNTEAVFFYTVGLTVNPQEAIVIIVFMLSSSQLVSSS